MVSLYRNYISLEKVVALLLKNLYPLYLRKLCARFGLNWPVVLEKILNFINIGLLVCNFLPLEIGVALHLKKVESPLSKDDLCQV